MFYLLPRHAPSTRTYENDQETVLCDVRFTLPFSMQDDGPSELEEVEHELNSGSPRKQAAGARKSLSNVMIEAFTMTFLAEWGDRSQITTISLAAVQNAFGVTVGGCVGHFLCTGAAVVGGKQLASVIDERTVNIVGAVMFILFGVLAIYEGPGE